MSTAIIALITAIAAAIPSIWGYKQYSDKKKERKRHEQTLDNIRKTIADGDTDAIRDELAKWL